MGDEKGNKCSRKKYGFACGKGSLIPTREGKTGVCLQYTKLPLPFSFFIYLFLNYVVFLCTALYLSLYLSMLLSQLAREIFQVATYTPFFSLLRVALCSPVRIRCCRYGAGA